MNRSSLALAAATALLLLASRLGIGGEPSPALPEGMLGFSGRLRGTVVRVGEDGKGFTLRVAKVEKTWKGNRAANPEAAVGGTFLVNARWEKGDEGAWRAVPRHVRFIRSLKAGEELSVEVVNDEGARLHILELSKEQRERGPDEGSGGGDGRGERPSFPKGFAGFSGVLEGRVVAVFDGGLGFLFRVEGVGRPWKGSEAERPGDAKDRVLLVQPRWVESDDGAWRPFARHLRFIRTLKKGEILRIEVRNRAGCSVHLLELSEGQRERAGRGDED